MNSLSFKDINDAEFKLFENNPIIRNPLSSFVIADPSVLTPDESHDGKWHLFCHTFFGVYRYESSDGVSFKNQGRIVTRAMRPNINRIDGKYYLFYERTRPVIMNALTLLGGKARFTALKALTLKAGRSLMPCLRKAVATKRMKTALLFQILFL